MSKNYLRNCGAGIPLAQVNQQKPRVVLLRPAVTSTSNSHGWAEASALLKIASLALFVQAGEAGRELLQFGFAESFFDAWEDFVLFESDVVAEQLA